MPQSMTGFANQTVTVGDWNLSIECKSVNSRFLDLTLKLPEVLKRSEPQLRKVVSDKFVRGKVELAIRLERAEQSSDVSINLEKLSEMKDALEKVIELMPNARAPTALDILMTQGIWVSDKLDVEALNKECIAVMPGIVESLRRHRLEEGARLEELLTERCDGIRTIIANYRDQLPELQAAQQQKLIDRINAIEVASDDKRLEEELVFLANKSDVAEELDRLDAHLQAISDALASKEPCGRRLDFLMQELNREANTLGSKTTSLVTTNAAVELKVLIEQMREQVQNLE
ncbi:MAG: YicC/YloC family endoribonuclease [Pseudomonadota bacterium]|nr:YicC/YloC family endoribonuclease [Pseudomonadota bacterium]